MQLLAGSLNVEVDGYLHTGYLSACPRSFVHLEGYQFERPVPGVIDVQKALELEDSTAPAAPAVTTESSSPPIPPASVIPDGLMLAIVFFFFAYLASLYWRRIRKIERPGWRPWGWAAVPVLLFVVIFYSALPAYESHRLHNLPPPWQNVPVQHYKNPEAATQAILHALVANTLPGCSVRIYNLAAIQAEVAFPLPVKEYTPGMVYAQSAYGRDGWGREFSLEPLADGQYRIASAGADGTQGTKDDIVFVTASNDQHNWEQLVNGVYVRRIGDQDACFVHRIKHGNFRYGQAVKARQLTGCGLYDVVWLDSVLRDHQRPKPLPIVAELKKHRESNPSTAGAEPLLFVRMDRPGT